MTHYLYTGLNDHEPPADRVRAWCGRDVPPAHATRTLTQVSCTACRKSFAARLRQMPENDHAE